MSAGVPVKYLVARIRGGDVRRRFRRSGRARRRRQSGALHLGRRCRRVGREGAARQAAAASASRWMSGSGRMAPCLRIRKGPSSPSGRRGAERASVNEHGRVELQRPEDGRSGDCQAVYGAVFGWTTLDLGNGQFWAMSAYGDYLEARTPGTRARAAEFGAAGFEDVVAAIAPLAAATRVSFNVTFRKVPEDADATAAKAVELGGTVIVPPVDAPYSRFTVLRDPQERRLPPRRSCPRTRTSGATPERSPLVSVAS